MIAAERGHVDTVTTLLQQGADPRLVDSQGDTALAMASRRKGNAKVRTRSCRSCAYVCHMRSHRTLTSTASVHRWSKLYESTQ